MYTLDGLASEVGCSVRAIKLYREKGLLSPPLQRPNYRDRAVWGDIHLRELRTIRNYLDANMTLADIGDAMHPEEPIGGSLHDLDDPARKRRVHWHGPTATIEIPDGSTFSTTQFREGATYDDLANAARQEES